MPLIECLDIAIVRKQDFVYAKSVKTVKHLRIHCITAIQLFECRWIDELAKTKVLACHNNDQIRIQVSASSISLLTYNCQTWGYCGGRTMVRPLQQAGLAHLRSPLPRWWVSSQYATATSGGNVKPFEAIPGPIYFKPYPTRRFFKDMKYFKNQFHLLGQNYVHDYGRIFRIPYHGEKKMIGIADPDATEKFFRLDGRIPQRMIVEPWKEWREKNNWPLGIATR